MQVRPLDARAANLFLKYAPRAPLAACIGLDEASLSPIRLVFEELERSNVLIVGRSRQAALGICTSILLDLASQILTTPTQRDIYRTPPIGILDFLGTHESATFTDAAMSLPLSVKLERATDTAMTTITDFHLELSRRQREPDTVRHPKFVFLCALQAAHGIRSHGYYGQPEVSATGQGGRFSELLRAGSALSLHSIVWCNSFENIHLTMEESISYFGHVIVLDDAGAIPGTLSRLPVRADGQAWYLDVRQHYATPVIPFTLPTSAWCEEFIGTIE